VNVRRRAAEPVVRAKGPTRRAKCPICGKPRMHDYRPFCSKHCAEIDLGHWLGGRYAVPGEGVAKSESDPEDGG